MKTKKYEMIVCPKCGREYLASEIYLPKEFFVNPIDIIRDEDDKILEVIGTTMNLTEKDICDKCNTPLNIKAKVNFEATVNDRFDFDNDYVQEIEVTTMELCED